MKIKTIILSALLISNILPAFNQPEDWTHFRGSSLNGIARPNDVPDTFNDSTNIIWKTEIDGKGWSSPVVYGNQVWVTTASADGKSLYALCLDFISGKLLYNIKLFTPDSIIEKHVTNTFATPTCCIEEGHVYANFGSLGTAGIRTSDGSVMWKRSDLKCDHMQGPGSSPFLYKDLLILHYDGTDVRFIIALNKYTGETVWKTMRPEEPIARIPKPNRKAYITPLIIKVRGADMLISNGAGMCNAFDPLTGKELWRVVKGDGGTIAMPFYEDGTVYIFTGQLNNEEVPKVTRILAINPDGIGDITGTNILWEKLAAGLQLLTPVIKDGLIYTVDMQNVMMCIDARTSETVWSSKMNSKFNASPVYTKGKIYFSSVRGEVVLVKASRMFEIIARNKLDGEIWATPAILRNSMLFRTDKALYKFGYR